MSLDKETVRRIAFLSRINVPEEDLEGLAGELSGIISFVEQLKEVDTSTVSPITSVADMSLRRRQDEVTDGGYRDLVLANAHDKDDEFYLVPKVVE